MENFSLMDDRTFEDVRLVLGGREEKRGKRHGSRKESSIDDTGHLRFYLFLLFDSSPSLAGIVTLVEITLRS